MIAFQERDLRSIFFIFQYPGDDKSSAFFPCIQGCYKLGGLTARFACNNGNRWVGYLRHKRWIPFSLDDILAIQRFDRSQDSIVKITTIHAKCDFQPRIIEVSHDFLDHFCRTICRVSVPASDIAVR